MHTISKLNTHQPGQNKKHESRDNIRYQNRVPGGAKVVTTKNTKTNLSVSSPNCLPRSVFTGNTFR